jgi:hypothetical protein
MLATGIYAKYAKANGPKDRTCGNVELLLVVYFDPLPNIGLRIGTKVRPSRGIT